MGTSPPPSYIMKLAASPESQISDSTNPKLLLATNQMTMSPTLNKTPERDEFANNEDDFDWDKEPAKKEPEFDSF